MLLLSNPAAVENAAVVVALQKLVSE